MEYPLSDCIDVQFTEVDRTGTSTAVNAVNSVANNGQNAVFIFGDAVTASDLKAGTRLAVYSVDGQLVGSAKVSESGSVSVPLNAGKGIFVVKSEGKSFKFIRR